MKIMMEKGSRISLSPDRMLEYPKREANMLRKAHTKSMAPISTCSI